ncbi:YopX family protein [Bacillus amyloliquefaciens]|uniref:YopX family protein n=1 Tax=Bacillus amyloliquefaciens TaxID=1390 RepID=UPI002DB9237F|nr:YopX family protein [Bacillus amyloliquefaciens]MEC3841548.1 YopX family protein [Bacillus amyloliquefaciens]
MNIIKIRYAFRHKKTNEIVLHYYTLSEIEFFGETIYSGKSNYELVSRDIWTGKKLMGKEIYAGDIICYKLHGRVFNLVVKWSDDDAGFYAGGIRWDFVQMNGELIGNVHQNPEWLGSATK